MNQFEKWIERVYRFFASLKLAVIVMSGLAILSAIGTIVEARYDTQYAQKLVYQSVWMYLVLGLLCVNLINVMIDRLPWKKRHMGFLFAHAGIVILVLGSLITKVYGIDGSMVFDIGQKNKYVLLQDNEFAVFSTFGDGGYKQIKTIPADFLRNPPEKKPVEISLGDKKLRILKYQHFSVRDEKIISSPGESDAGQAVRVQLQNDRVNMTKWLMRTPSMDMDIADLGPAQIILAMPGANMSHISGNAIVLFADKTDILKYEIHTKSKNGITAKGTLRAGDSVSTGWMGIELRILKFIPEAIKKVEYIAKETPSGVTTPSLLLEYNGAQHWLGLNSNLKLYTDISMYLVSFRNQVYPLDFEISLDQFRIGRYQGTRRAMTYESDVSIDGVGKQTISMNNPMKHKGLTFYQASFQENEKGEPITSILSVNKDPGRPFKYLGSFLITLGTILMFYFKQKMFGSTKTNAQTENT